MPTYTIGESPVVVDAGASTLIQIQNTGTAQILCEPLGRRVPAGNTQTVPGYSQQPTTLRTAPGSTTTAVVTLTAGSPAAAPGPAFVRFDPGAAGSMQLSVSGGGLSWYTDEGLTTAATFPRTVATATTLWPSAEGTVTITATVGTLTKTAGMSIRARGNPAFVFTPTTATDTTAQELAQDGVAAGSATYARWAGLDQTVRTGGPIVGWCGDSLTVGSNSSNASVFAFRNMASKLAGGLSISPASLTNAAAGWKAADVLAGMDALIAAGAQTIYVQIGTNDGATALATWQAQIIASKAKADAAGIPIAYGTIPPNGATAGGYSAKNTWLKFWCATNKIGLADTYTALVDPTTGLMKAAYNTDNTHPNDAGHLAMAQVIVPVLQAIIRTPVWPVTSASEGGLVADPLMTGTYGGLGVLAGFFAEVTYSHVAASAGDLPAGQWERISHANPTGSTRASTFGLSFPTGWSVGDRLAFFLYARGTALTKVTLANNAGVAFSVPMEGTSSPGPIAFAHTMAAGETELNLGLVMSAAANSTTYIDFGACDVFNLTTLGLTLPL